MTNYKTSNNSSAKLFQNISINIDYVKQLYRWYNKQLQLESFTKVLLFFTFHSEIVQLTISCNLHHGWLYSREHLSYVKLFTSWWYVPCWFLPFWECFYIQWPRRKLSKSCLFTRCRLWDNVYQVDREEKLNTWCTEQQVVRCLSLEFFSMNLKADVLLTWQTLREILVDVHALLTQRLVCIVFFLQVSLFLPFVYLNFPCRKNWPENNLDKQSKMKQTSFSFQASEAWLTFRTYSQAELWVKPVCSVVDSPR